MSNLFKKAIFFTDLHFGYKSNSKIFNNDCLDFIDFVIQTGKKEKCETCVFLGDWHNNRASINVSTLNYSVTAIDRLSESFDQIIFIPGNHDEHYRDTRNMNSVIWAKKYDNLKLCNEIETIGDVAVVPWLVGDEHKKIPKLEAKYMFGHLELPNFLLNSMIRMPDTNELQREDVKFVEQVYTGHFHKRQEYNNITYIGNAFPHNYADAGDDNRGVMILEWDHDPKYIAWPDAPKYRKFMLSDVLENTSLLKKNMYCRVELDVDISYEEANFIKEEFIPEFDLRELSLLNSNISEDTEQFEGEINFESVDSIVTSHLTQLDSQQYNSALMLDIYRNL